MSKIGQGKEIGVHVVERVQLKNWIEQRIVLVGAHRGGSRRGIRGGAGHIEGRGDFVGNPRCNKGASIAFNCLKTQRSKGGQGRIRGHPLDNEQG